MTSRLSLLTAVGACASIVSFPSAKASSISILAGDPQLPGVVSAVWRSPQGDVIHNLQMPAQGQMTSSDMAAVTMQRLRSIPEIELVSLSLTGNQVSVNSTPGLDPLDGVLPGGSIYWGTGTTGQESMKLLSHEISQAAVAAVGHFEPFFQPNQPAIFTAGIVTDVGELTAQVSAQELNFQTDGPIICQALFQRLAPRAPQYGAQINYAGDRLEIYFDPAYTVTQGGIIFGTSSPSQGFSGTITTPLAPVEPIPGDNNGDGVVDAADYVDLRKGVVIPYTDENYDIWRSHFGEMVSVGRMASEGVVVPEPATLMLVVLMATVCSLRRSSPA